jgi:spore coat polysaccharide biosynthesis protein SpsF
MNIVAIIQARMGSSRLPAKIMADIAGEPMLVHVIRRARQARRIRTVVLATTTDPGDDITESFCHWQDIPCFRGSPDDLLDRYYQTARYWGADTIVRLTADCPLLDSAVIDQVIELYQETAVDYASNTLECTYPDGLDTEVMSFVALSHAWREAKLKSEREHVTPYITNHPEIFTQKGLRHREDLSHLRWTVDELSDLIFVRAVFHHLGHATFGMGEILDLIDRYPGLIDLNKGIIRNEGYAKSLSEDEIHLKCWVSA